MSFSINHVVLVGNVTKDIELKYTQTNQPVARMSMATNRSVKKDDGSYQDMPTFHNVVIWGKLAEFIQKNVPKGAKVYVDGRVENRSYQAQDGTQKYISEVVADSVIPMVAQKTATTAPAPARPYNASAEPVATYAPQTAPAAPATPEQQAFVADAEAIFQPDAPHGVDQDGIPF